MGWVRQIGQEGESLRGAIDHSDLPFPKEMDRLEAEGGSEVEWETRVVEVPKVLSDHPTTGEGLEQSPKRDR